MLNSNHGERAAPASVSLLRAGLPYVFGVLAVVITGGALLLIGSRLTFADAAMLHLLPILLIAVRFGLWPSLMTSVLAAVSSNYFFSRPYFDVGFADIHDLLTLTVFVLTAATLNYWAETARRHEAALRRQAEEQAHAKAAAETARLQAALVSSVSHDFRTPLATIIGAASSLREGDAAFSPEGRRELLATIQEAGERLHRYAVNLLNTGRLEAGALTLSRDWAALEDLVATALAGITPAEARLRVSLALPDDLPMLYVDRALIEQVFLNLLDNAVKYAPADTAVNVTARDAGDRVEVRVSNAVLAPPADLTRIFERFYRPDPGASQGGSGLGLSICKGFVEAHDGTIAAAHADGRFTVTVRLPVSEAGRRLARDLDDG